MSLSVAHLSHNFGSQQALRDVDFRIGQGEIAALLGPNGAGKSTLLRILTGCLRPTRGTVLLCGESPYGAGEDLRRRFGYLPEHNPLYTDLYVAEYLDFIARLYGVPSREERIRDVVAATLLGEALGKPIHALSRGFRQRLGLAAALLPDPEVLILDEPLSGMDPNQQGHILGLLGTMKERKCILFSTHTLSEVEKIATRVLILSDGALRENRLVDPAEPPGLLEKRFKELTQWTRTS